MNSVTILKFKNARPLDQIHRIGFAPVIVVPGPACRMKTVVQTYATMAFVLELVVSRVVYVAAFVHMRTNALQDIFASNGALLDIAIVTAQYNSRRQNYQQLLRQQQQFCQVCWSRC